MSHHAQQPHAQMPLPPPPAIIVEPFSSAPSSLPAGAGVPQPQLSTYHPSSHPSTDALPRARSPSPSSPSSAQTHSPPLPAYQQGDWRSAADQEKDAYLSRGSDDSHQHWADHPAPAPGYRQHAPPAILLPPKAAFAGGAPASPMSPHSLKKAMEFGDVSSIRSGATGGGGEKAFVAGRGGAEVRKSGMDWERFDKDMREREKEKESEWLQRKTRNSKKWYWLGWIGTLLVIVAIAAGIGAHFAHKSSSDDSEPTVPSLGGLNQKNITSASHSSSASFLSASATDAGVSLQSQAATSSAADPVYDDEEEPTSSSTTTQAARQTTTTEAPAVVTTTTTTPAAVRTTTTTAAARATTTPLASSSSLASTSTSAARGRATSTSTSTADERLRKRAAAPFGDWQAIEWKASSPAGEKRSGDWDKIEFSSPHSNAHSNSRKRHEQHKKRLTTAAALA
ncbi:hypothetical protein JCM10213_000059 [Rhodosporidiobolus nylandii]